MKAARSLLAVPATRRKMVEKALASAADAVFLDLEDAVAPDSKAAARRDVVSALKELDWQGRLKLYRANALDTPYFYRDLIGVVEEAGGALDAVIVPKVNRPEDLHVVSTLLSQLELAMDLEKGRIKIEAQIESAEGLVNESFSPTAREVDWAKKVVAAYEEANVASSGSVSVDGQMVDASSIKLARNTLGKVPKRD